MKPIYSPAGIRYIMESGIIIIIISMLILEQPVRSVAGRGAPVGDPYRQ